MYDLSCHLNCDLSALEQRTLRSDCLMEAKVLLWLLWHSLPQFIQFSRDLQSAECPAVVSTGNQVSFIAVNKKQRALCKHWTNPEIKRQKIVWLKVLCDKRKRLAFDTLPASLSFSPHAIEHVIAVQEVESLWAKLTWFVSMMASIMRYRPHSRLIESRQCAFKAVPQRKRKFKAPSRLKCPKMVCRRFTFYISNPSLETSKLENKRYVNGFGLEKQHRDRFDFFLSIALHLIAGGRRFLIFGPKSFFTRSKKVFPSKTCEGLSRVSNFCIISD